MNKTILSFFALVFALPALYACAPSTLSPQQPEPRSTGPSATVHPAETLDMDFVFVQGGCFRMGSDKPGDPENEQPAHRVCVDSFWMASHEVTHRQFDAFLQNAKAQAADFAFRKEGWISKNPIIPQLRTNDPQTRETLANHPVTNVSWYAAKAMADWMREKTGLPVRLPTEAEWEYACRGRNGEAEFSSPDGKYSLEIPHYSASRQSLNKTFPVCSFPANSLGIFDLSGNVREWCEDWHDDRFYRNASENAPIQTHPTGYKVARGGCYSSVAKGLRCSARYGQWPDLGTSNVGFRLVIAHPLPTLPPSPRHVAEAAP